jgi:hypothetical protein
MTGWGVFWNVYRRGMTMQAQVQSKRMKQAAAAKAPEQTTSTRSVVTTQAKPAPNTTKGKDDDDKAWVNEWDDVSLYAFLYLH